MKTKDSYTWTKNLDKWNDFLKNLDKTKIDYEFPNIPGLTGNLNDVWNLDNYVNWLKKITDRQKDKVILIGHSNGGRIALAFANQHPEKVEKLILIDSAGIYHNELPLALKRVIFKILAKLGKAFRNSSTIKNAFYKLTGENDYKDANPNMKQTMINLLNSDKLLRPKNIQVPTLIFWGKEDKIAPLSDGILMNKLIKNSKLEIIKNARHSPMFTNAQEIADIIIKEII